MKHLSILIPAITLTLFFLTSSAQAEQPADRKVWTPRDTAFEFLFAALVYVDWKQTIEFTQNPHKYPDCYETNPLIGRHPTRRRVNSVVGASLLAHAFTAYILPRPYRGWWQWVWIGVEADVIHTNRVVIGVTTTF